MAQARRDLTLHFTTMTHSDAKLLAGRLFESSDKNGSLLANLVAHQHFQMVVPELRSSTGDQIVDPTAILHIFYVYYKSLYSQASSPSEVALVEKLRSLSLPFLTAEDVESLDTPISSLEIE